MNKGTERKPHDVGHYFTAQVYFISSFCSNVYLHAVNLEADGSKALGNDHDVVLVNLENFVDLTFLSRVFQWSAHKLYSQSQYVRCCSENAGRIELDRKPEGFSPRE